MRERLSSGRMKEQLNAAAVDGWDEEFLLRRGVLTVEEAGRLFRLGRTKAYEEAHRYLETGGECGLPVVRFGRALRCPTAKLRVLMGLSEDPTLA